MLKWSYPAEKYRTGVHNLATGRDALPQRLMGALESIGRLMDSDIPDAEIRAEHRRIMETCDKEAAVGNEGTWQATINKITVEEAYKIAFSIAELESRITQKYEDEARTPIRR